LVYLRLIRYLYKAVVSLVQVQASQEQLPIKLMVFIQIPFQISSWTSDYICGHQTGVSNQVICGSIDDNSKYKGEIYTTLNSAYWTQKEVIIRFEKGRITGVTAYMH